MLWWSPWQKQRQAMVVAAPQLSPDGVREFYVYAFGRPHQGHKLLS